MTESKGAREFIRTSAAGQETTWIRDLAGCLSRLSEIQIQALLSAIATAGVSGLTSGKLQRLLFLSSSEASQLARNLENIFRRCSNPGDIPLVIEALTAGLYIRPKAHSVEIVCTSPSSMGVPVRSTFATAKEMVLSARKQIIAVGYSFTRGATKLLREIATAQRDRGVHVILIGNGIDRQISFIRSLWNTEIPIPAIFTRKNDPSDELAALHAKLLICDSLTALITSANFSQHGLHGNIEIGVKLRSDSVTQLVEFINAMISTGAVEPVAWD